MNKKAGFTRLETVVVLSGAAILAATIFPLAVRAQNGDKSQAYLQSCQSNLKQVGLGILQYQQDYDDKLPPATHPRGRDSWRSMIQPYIQSTRIFRCPSNPNSLRKTQDTIEISATSRELKPGAAGKEVQRNAYDPNDGKMVTFPGIEYADSDYVEVPQLPFIPISYSANANAMWNGGSLTTKEMPSPAGFILVGESTRDDATMPFTRSPSEFGRGRALFSGHIDLVNAVPTADNVTPTDEEAPGEATPFAVTNCLFADGHVKAFRPIETLGMWFNGAPDDRAVNNYERRLSAADEFFTNWLSTGEMPEGDEEMDVEETGDTEVQGEK